MLVAGTYSPSLIPLQHQSYSGESKMDMAEWRMKGTTLLVSELLPISQQILHPHSNTTHLWREAIPQWRLLAIENVQLEMMNTSPLLHM